MKALGYRVAWSSAVLVAVLLAVFMVGHVVGDPARLMVSVNATDAEYQAARHTLGLDQPFVVQLHRFIHDAIFHGFGKSIWQGIPAMQLALERLPATLLLTSVAFLFAIPVALLLAVFSALRPSGFFDRLLDVGSLAGISVVPFWVALMAILVFAVWLGLLPTSGYGSASNLVLPVLVLSLRPIGRLAQVAKSAIEDEMSSDYVDAARSRGISERRLVCRHALRNAALPIITLTGDEVAAVIDGAVVVEVIFAWPGVGNLMIQAIEHRDLPVIESAVFITTVLVIVVNLLVDLSYMALDPRLRRRAVV